MRFNHTNPIGRGSEALRDMLLTAEEREAFRKPLPGNFPTNQVSSVKDFLKIDPNLKTGWGSAWNNFSQFDSRSPNDQEATALIFTFGDTVGKFLIDIIEIGRESDETSGKIRIVLPDNYNPDNLESLGVFICKATRVWQKKVGLYNQDKGWAECEADYSYTQLYLPQKKLTGTQHAAAVQDWFHANYGIEYHLIGGGPNRIDWESIQKPILKVMGFDLNDNLGKPDVLRFVKHYYARLIEEIRDPCHIPVLRAVHCR